MRSNRTSRLFAFIALGSALRVGTVHGQSSGADEDKVVKVKAAYLLNFAKFVTWPADAFHDEHSPIVIGIVGTDPFGAVLDQTIKDKSVSGRALKVQRFPWKAGDGVSAIRQCHVLYVSPSLGDATAGLVAALAQSPILLVGEGVEFAKLGGSLGFVMEEGRIVFWARKNVAETARLELSSQLLKLARPIASTDDAQARDAVGATKGD